MFVGRYASACRRRQIVRQAKDRPAKVRTRTRQYQASTPEECNVYSQQAILLRPLFGRAAWRSHSGSKGCRSSEQSRVVKSRRAINIALLWSEERTAEEAKALSAAHFASYSWTLAIGSKASQALTRKYDFH